MIITDYLSFPTAYSVERKDKFGWQHFYTCTDPDQAIKLKDKYNIEYNTNSNQPKWEFRAVKVTINREVL